MGRNTDQNLNKEQLAKAIGNRVKAIRAERGISQSELSRICGKDKQHIELIENGKISPNIFTLYTISKGLNCSLNELMKIE